MPAGAVVQRIAPSAPMDGWLEQVEPSLLAIGATMARLYPDHDLNPHQLRNAGYRAREELFFASDIVSKPKSGLILRPVLNDQDWRDKARFHRESGRTPDGHPNRPADWIEMERRKCSFGMEAFLVEEDGVAVGAIGAICLKRMLRVKNVIVHPTQRGRSIARDMIGLMAELGRSRGISQLCLVAVKGGPGERLYRRCGMHLIGMQVEWSKTIGPELIKSD